MPNTTPPNEPRCSFCGKTETQANQLVSGPDGVHICDECIATCNEMMAQNAIEQVREDERLLTPQEIKARLDEYVIGQDEAKKILAVAVHNHYKRVFYADALKGGLSAGGKKYHKRVRCGPTFRRRWAPSYQEYLAYCLHMIIGHQGFPRQISTIAPLSRDEAIKTGNSTGPPYNKEGSADTPLSLFFPKSRRKTD